jgi:hypothetical protein
MSLKRKIIAIRKQMIIAVAWPDCIPAESGKPLDIVIFYGRFGRGGFGLGTSHVMIDPDSQQTCSDFGERGAVATVTKVCQAYQP